MAQSDLAGVWQYLGTITPQFEQWSRFPLATSSNNSTIRLTFYDNNEFRKIGSFGYLRVVYEFPDLFYSPWKRVYPNFTRQVLEFPIPSELLYVSTAIVRHFEVMKRNKYNRPNLTIIDSDWSVAIESLELIALNSQDQILLEQSTILEQTAQIIRNILPGE
jgi:hypothetical protein